MPDPTPTLPGRPSSTLGPKVAAVVCLAHALTLAGFAVLYVWEILHGASSNLARALGGGLIIVIVAGWLGLLARDWSQGETRSRTPTIVWNVLLIPIAYSLLQGVHPWIALAVGGSALVGIVAAWSSPAQLPDGLT